jgi:hypothetical protein
MSTYWNSDFDPVTVGVLTSAFDKAMIFLQGETELAGIDTQDAGRVLTVALTKLAENGERDPIRLANGAIAHLRQSEQIKRSVAHLKVMKFGQQQP